MSDRDAQMQAIGIGGHTREKRNLLLVRQLPEHFFYIKRHLDTRLMGGNNGWSKTEVGVCSRKRPSDPPFIGVSMNADDEFFFLLSRAVASEGPYLTSLPCH